MAFFLHHESVLHLAIKLLYKSTVSLINEARFFSKPGMAAFGVDTVQNSLGTPTRMRSTHTDVEIRRVKNKAEFPSTTDFEGCRSFRPCDRSRSCHAGFSTVPVAGQALEYAAQHLEYDDQS